MVDIVPFEQRFTNSTEYNRMKSIISDESPEVNRATAFFCKTQSQYMDNMLTVSHFTPIRNLRQILAEMQKIRMALGEAYYLIEKKKLDIEEKRELLLSSSGYVARRLELDISELEWQINSTMEYVAGAIRKLTNYTLQYKSIQNSHSLSDFTEEDFEREEEAYHIAKAFEQSLNAARSRGGYIDEGNLIYFNQIGINGSTASFEVAKYLVSEKRLLESGKEPTHSMQLDFIECMIKKFSGCSKQYACHKGMHDTITTDALI